MGWFLQGILGVGRCRPCSYGCFKVVHPEAEGQGGFGEDAHHPRLLQPPQLHVCGG